MFSSFLSAKKVPLLEESVKLSSVMVQWVPLNSSCFNVIACFLSLPMAAPPATGNSFLSTASYGVVDGMISSSNWSVAMPFPSPSTEYTMAFARLMTSPFFRGCAWPLTSLMYVWNLRPRAL